MAVKAELVRLAVRRGPAGETPHAVHDRDGTMPGRGAYLCRAADGAGRPAGDCLAKALRSGAISRTLRAQVSVDPKLVESVGR